MDYKEKELIKEEVKPSNDIDTLEGLKVKIRKVLNIKYLGKVMSLDILPIAENEILDYLKDIAPDRKFSVIVNLSETNSIDFDLAELTEENLKAREFLALTISNIETFIFNALRIAPGTDKVLRSLESISNEIMNTTFPGVRSHVVIELDHDRKKIKATFKSGAGEEMSEV